jgi:CubicO group peptidase (beta-lactamase class C family)
MMSAAELRYALLPLALLTVVIGPSRPVANLEPQVDRIVRDVIRTQRIPAATVAIAMGGRIVYSKGFGAADLENAVAADSGTLIRTGSIAKPISATAAMTLVDAGKLDLDAPVQKYCPAFPVKQWTVTTRELLTHTSGIRHYQGTEADSTAHFPRVSDGLSIFAADPLLFESGAKYSYSTFGYTVLGCVIEGASGETFFDYLRAHVLLPSGMTHTFVDDVFAIVPRRARGYHIVDGKPWNAGLVDTSYKIPGGGLVSTAEDFARFAIAITAGRIVKPSTRDAMWAPTTFADGRMSNHGLGGFNMTIGGERHLVHSGGQQGASTAIEIVPSRRFAVAVFTNDEDAEPFDIIRPVLAAYHLSRAPNP